MPSNCLNPGLENTCVQSKNHHALSIVCCHMNEGRAARNNTQLLTPSQQPVDHIDERPPPLIKGSPADNTSEDDRKWHDEFSSCRTELEIIRLQWSSREGKIQFAGFFRS